MSCDNTNECSCTYPCSNHAKCCECIRFHRNRNELPACYFAAEAERTYDRSIEYFIGLHSKGRI